MGPTYRFSSDFKYFLTVTVFCAAVSTFAQEPAPTGQSRLQAMIVYNIARSVTWLAADSLPRNRFRITVVGGTAHNSGLSALASRKVMGLPIEVVDAKVNAQSPADMIYVASAAPVLQHSVVGKISDRQVSAAFLCKALRTRPRDRDYADISESIFEPFFKTKPLG